MLSNKSHPGVSAVNGAIHVLSKYLITTRGWITVTEEPQPGLHYTLTLQSLYRYYTIIIPSLNFIALSSSLAYQSLLSSSLSVGLYLRKVLHYVTNRSRVSISLHIVNYIVIIQSLYYHYTLIIVHCSLIITVISVIIVVIFCRTIS